MQFQSHLNNPSGARILPPGTDTPILKTELR
jgi:hypothetical protein